MSVYKLSQAGSLITARTNNASMLAGYGDFGAMTRIGYSAQVSDSAAFGTMSFSNIPQTFQDLIIVIAFRDTDPSTNVFNPIWFNGNSSGTNYSETILQGDGSTAVSSRLTSQPYFQFIRQPAATATAGIYSATICHILNYANTTTRKTMLTRNCYDLNGSGQTRIIVGNWNSTAAITSIVISSSAAIRAGSTAALYGVRSSAS